VAFRPDGNRIASGSMDKTIKVWKRADGTGDELATQNFKRGAVGLPEAGASGWVDACAGWRRQGDW